MLPYSTAWCSVEQADQAPLPSAGGDGAVEGLIGRPSAHLEAVGACPPLSSAREPVQDADSKLPRHRRTEKVPQRRLRRLIIDATNSHAAVDKCVMRLELTASRRASHLCVTDEVLERRLQLLQLLDAHAEPLND